MISRVNGMITRKVSRLRLFRGPVKTICWDLQEDTVVPCLTGAHLMMNLHSDEDFAIALRCSL